jgi:hypothetical protein
LTEPDIRVGWTPELIEQLRSLRKEGLTAAQISEGMGIPVMAVYNACTRHSALGQGSVWTKERIEQLREMRMAGMTYDVIGERFGMTTEAVAHAARNHGIPKAILEENLSIPVFRGDLKLPMDDYIITCDYHSPYYSVLWHNRTLAIAERLGIKKAIIVGDLIDFGFAAFWYSDHKPGIDDESDENRRLVHSLLSAFDEIYLVKGNHEDRLGRQTNGLVQARYLLELWAGEDYGKRFHYSLYDKLTIGSEWLLVHPKSYSIISTKVAKILASKFHKNILNTHGHFLGYGYDISGKYYAADIGGIFDKEKIEYKNLKTSTHPEWGNGFAVLKNGHPYLFDERTDWEFWLGEHEEGRCPNQTKENGST